MHVKDVRVGNEESADLDRDGLGHGHGGELKGRRGLHRRGLGEGVHGEQDATVGQGRCRDAEAEEPPPGHPGKAAVQAVSPGRRGRSDERRPLSAQVGEGDGGGLLAAGERGEEAGAQRLVAAAGEEAAGALVLAFEEGQSAAGAGGGFLEAAKVEGAIAESAQFGGHAESQEPMASQLGERLAERP